MPRLTPVPLCWLLISTLLSSMAILAYIPASPTNDTAFAVGRGLNITDTSQLEMYWQSGIYHTDVSFQLAGRDSLGTSRGALIHFSEEHVNETSTPATNAPWIALVSCDANATHASMDTDVFTLARDKGANAALLYSLRSEACVINAEYSNGVFAHVLDVFTTQGNNSSHLIENQFSIQTFKFYDAQQMNDSAVLITESINSKMARTPEYIFADLIAYNSTDPDRDIPTPNPSGNWAPLTTVISTSLNAAMFILYAITGWF